MKHLKNLHYSVMTAPEEFSKIIFKRVEWKTFIYIGHNSLLLNCHVVSRVFHTLRAVISNCNVECVSLSPVICSRYKELTGD